MLSCRGAKVVWQHGTQPDNFLDPKTPFVDIGPLSLEPPPAETDKDEYELEVRVPNDP